MHPWFIINWYSLSLLPCSDKIGYQHLLIAFALPLPFALYLIENIMKARKTLFLLLLSFTVYINLDLSTYLISIAIQSTLHFCALT